MKDTDCIAFLQWALPRLRMRWPGFRKVRQQVCKRVQRRMNELQLAGVAAYRALLEAQADEWPVLDAMCRISISRFYRDWGVFDFVRDVILPRLAREASESGTARVRIWSAGCASGEEVYTLTIIWNLCVQEQFPDVRLEVLGTDADPHLLERARRGDYSRGSFRDFPDAWLSQAFDVRDSLLHLKSEFRRGVELQEQDIREELPDGTFDCILCRNLAFTYFEESLQREVLERLLTRLKSGGWLLTGKQEPLPGHRALVEARRPRMGVYRKDASSGT